MAYYNHEYFPWPRNTAQQVNLTPSYEGQNLAVHCDATNLRSNPNVDQLSRLGLQQDTQVPQNAHKSAKTAPQRARGMMMDDMKKKLIEGFSKPVESSKAERMMLMMGWQGGALGRTGEGIKEPLAPDLCLKKRAGFGQVTMDTESQNAVKPRTNQTDPEERLSICFLSPIYEHVPQKRERMHKYRNKPQLKKKKGVADNNCRPVRLEILEDLLNFVRDNRRVKMKYDRTVTVHKRRLIHRMVESIMHEDPTTDKYCKLAQPALLSVFTVICDSNEFVLLTRSEGEEPHRQLCVYKDAPAHVYLITNEDLQEEDENEEDADDNILVQQQSLIANIERVAKRGHTIDESQSEEKIDNNNILDKHNKQVVTLKKDQENKKILSEEVTVKKDNIEAELFGKDSCPFLGAQINVPFVKENPCPSLGTPAAQIKVQSTEDVESKKEEYIKGLFRESLKEFFETKKYTEMRFLGDFNVLQQKVLDDFLANLNQCLADVVPDDNWVLDVVLDNRYAVVNDNCGTIIIVKIIQN